MNDILTITEISYKLKQVVEGNPDLTSVWIKGEISNLTYHSSGHIYLTLKDSNSAISAAFFKFANKNLKFKLEEGMSVFAFGSISIYEKRGSYQFIIADVQLEGIGELQRKIEELKNKLYREGLFDSSRKKEIPFLPKKIGIVTSPTGAAFRDILKVALRRYPEIEVLLAPAKVQGDDASETIVKAIEELNKDTYAIDVIIAGRGGGSFEDLMPFNTEEVVRAFANSKVPIISAVGHQVDHPLSDEAADLYAPTPSAAAEIAIPLKEDLDNEISKCIKQLNQSLTKQLDEYKIRLDSLMQRRIFTNPKELIFMRQIELDDIKNRMMFSLKDKINEGKYRFSNIPDINRIIKNVFDQKKNQLMSAAQSLHQLSPLNVISRGYNVIKKENKFIKSIGSLNQNDNIDIYLKDGKINCDVKKLEKGDFLINDK